ncbi:MAG: ComEC/Rec2 family competence protein [Planctomycetota bacterium]|nr:ComEC/Rec2 family competence protein [Planctomycetota bacterium]
MPLLIALAALCAGRAAQAAAVETAAPRALQAPVTGHVQRPRGQASRARGTEAWDLRRQAARLLTPHGALAPGDLIAVDPAARRAARARSLHRPIAPRASSIRPRADEVVRAGRPDRAVHSSTTSGGALRPLERLRARGLAACRSHPDPTCAGLLAALAFGDRGGLERDVTDLFTRTGTRHLLALSGFHVGLLAVLLVLPLAREVALLVRRGAGARGWLVRPDSALLSAAVVLAFVPLSGGGAPATRAAIGLSLALLSRRLRRRPSVLNLIGVAALAEVASDPLAPLRAGTQLSYLATLALVLTAAPVARALMGDPSPGAGGRRWLDPVGPTGWPRPPVMVALIERFRALCCGALAAGAVASLATLPVVWCVFGEWSPVSLLATPIATPPVALLVVVGWFRLVLPHAILDTVAQQGSEGLIAWLTLMDRLPWTPLPLPERPALLLVCAAAMIGLAAARLRPRDRQQGRGDRLLGSLGTVAFGLLLAPWPGPALGPNAPGPQPQSLEVHVLDVGNGTAIVARAPGAPTWVLDAGSRDRIAVADEGTGALLRALDTGSIHVGVSHDHADHAGAIPWITARWPADLLHGPRASLHGPHPRGVVWLEGPEHGAEPSALWVAAISSGMPDPNEGSAIFDLRWRSPSGHLSRVVLCGDAEGRGLRSILDGGGASPWLEPGPVDLLLMPHHGSETRHLARLLDRTRPALAVVSGEVPEDAAEFARRGIPLHVTARDGPLFWQPAAPLRARSSRTQQNSPPGGPRPVGTAYTEGAASLPRGAGTSLDGAPPMSSLIVITRLSLALMISAAGSSFAADEVQRGVEEPEARRLQDDDAEPIQRPVRRVLRLRNGGVLRGPTRKDPSGGWSIKGRGGWTALPAAGVLEATEERAALLQLKALRADAGQTPAEKVDGALALGLLPEACELCDELLEQSPTDLQLRSAATRAGRHLGGLPARGAPDEVEALLELGALQSLLMREVVAERLVTAAGRAKLLETLRSELRSKRPPRRSFAAFATGRLFPGEDPRPLLLHAVYDPSAPARESAARAISDVGAHAIGAPLVRALESGNGAVRLRTVEALGASRDGAFVEPLMGRLYTLSARSGSASGYRPPRSHLFVGTQRAYVQDFDVEVAQGSSVADPVVNTLVEGVVLDVRVIGVQEVQVRTELRSIRGALGRITGRKPGSSNKAWRTWWEGEEAERFRRPLPEEENAPPSSHDGAPRQREAAKAPR